MKYMDVVGPVVAEEANVINVAFDIGQIVVNGLHDLLGKSGKILMPISRQQYQYIPKGVTKVQRRLEGLLRPNV